MNSKDRSEFDAVPALTERQYAVFMCHAQAMKQAEIMHALGMARATVNTHNGNIVRKLGLQNLMQARQFAYRYALESGCRLPEQAVK